MAAAKNPTTDELVDQIIDMHIAGKSYKDIALGVGAGISRVKLIVQHYHNTGARLRVGGKKDAPEYYFRIIELYQGGMKQKAIAALLKRSGNTVAGVIKAYNETGDVPKSRVEIVWPKTPRKYRTVIDSERRWPPPVVTPVAQSDFIKPITRKQLMAGRAA